MEGTTWPTDPNQKGRQNSTRFCNYCCTKTDIPQVGAGRRYGMKNWSASKMKGLPRKKLLLLKLTTQNEDPTRDQNNGPDARTSNGETRTMLTMGLAGIPPTHIRISLQNRTSHIETTVLTTEDRKINTRISQLLEVMEIDLETNTSTIRLVKQWKLFWFSIGSAERLLTKYSKPPAREWST